MNPVRSCYAVLQCFLVEKCRCKCCSACKSFTQLHSYINCSICILILCLYCISSWYIVFVSSTLVLLLLKLVLPFSPRVALTLLRNNILFIELLASGLQSLHISLSSTESSVKDSQSLQRSIARPFFGTCLVSVSRFPH